MKNVAFIVQNFGLFTSKPRLFLEKVAFFLRKSTFESLSCGRTAPFDDSSRQFERHIMSKANLNFRMNRNTSNEAFQMKFRQFFYVVDATHKKLLITS